MSVKVAEINDVPAALPISETDDEREKLIREAAEENASADENSLNETEDEEFENLEQTAKPSRKKLFLAFVGFVFGFVFLILILCWFFGIGVFAATKPQAVDRTAKTNSPNSVTPVTEDEKLKMALNLVAEKKPNGNTDSLIDPSESENVAANSSVDIPPTKATDLNETVVVPDALSETNRNTVNAATSTTTNRDIPQNSVISTENPSLLSSNNANRTENQSSRQTENAPFGRSLFFGIERKENVAQTDMTSQSNNQAVSGNQNANLTNLQATAIPFGTLLPIRFLGAVYTLRASGGLVRMELTRSVSGENFSYPAGTVLVGTLRGSEYKRAFISVVGLIDPKTGGLVKFEGEVMGNDGASGIVGRRRQVKSTWSRVFGGLREAGAVALGAIGNRRSGGGTIVISDSTSKASGVLTDELSGLIGNNRNSNEFVEISAGTTGFVLVTDLPDEISGAERLGQNSKTATGLTTSELADLFSEGSKEKLRAALPRMTPAFRQLAEKVLAME